MKDYSRITDKNGVNFTMSMWAGTAEDLKIYRSLAKFEDKFEQGTLVDIKAVAKFVQGIMEKDSCPCGYMFFGESVDGYMIDKCDDWCWCEKNCDTVFKTKDYTPCWEMYLKAKLRELQNKGE